MDAKSTYKLRARKLSPRHYKLLRLILAGYPSGEAGKICNYSTNRTSIVVNSPIFKSELNRMLGSIETAFVTDASTDPVHAVLKSEALKSAQTLIFLRDSPSRDDKIRQKSAIEILDRSGYGKEVKVRGEVAVMVDDSVKAAIQLAMAGKEGGK